MVRHEKGRNGSRNLTPLELVTTLPEGLLPEGAGDDFFRGFVGAARPWLPDYYLITNLINGKDGQLHAHCVVLPWPLGDTPADADLAMGD